MNSLRSFALSSLTLLASGPPAGPDNPPTPATTALTSPTEKPSHQIAFASKRDGNWGDLRHGPRRPAPDPPHPPPRARPVRSIPLVALITTSVHGRPRPIGTPYPTAGSNLSDAELTQ
jgi:hypothetical protein